MNGKPAAGMGLTLWREEAGEAWTQLLAAVTNADGRTEKPLLGPDTMKAGRYMIKFEVEAYFRAIDVKDAGRFLAEVPIAFVIDDAAGNYHVPLLVSPWSYSTYRGS